jgi:hypothetical protein
VYDIIVRMFESVRVGWRAASAVEQLAASWEELAAIEPVALSGAELLDLLDRLETTARRHIGVARRVIAELAARDRRRGRVSLGGRLAVAPAAHRPAGGRRPGPAGR